MFPGYWLFETSGKLRPVVIAYLEGEPLSDTDCATMRAYLRQWVMSPVWDQNPHAGAEERRWLAAMRNRVDALTSRAAIENWIEQAADGGLDPL